MHAVMDAQTSVRRQVVAVDSFQRQCITQHLFRMSLVQRQAILVRSDDHREKWGFTKQLSEDGIIAVASQDGSTVLSTTWIPTHHLQANRRRTYSCIHANPYFGRVGPGESQTCRGYVLLSEGNLEHAWSETNRVAMEYV
jgi:hypothetical protein